MIQILLSLSSSYTSDNFLIQRYPTHPFIWYGGMNLIPCIGIISSMQCLFFLNLTVRRGVIEECLYSWATINRMKLHGSIQLLGECISGDLNIKALIFFSYYFFSNIFIASIALYYGDIYVVFPQRTMHFYPTKGRAALNISYEQLVAFCVIIQIVMVMKSIPQSV